VSTVFEHQVNLRWRDLDALGHVNHAVFLTYLEEGRDAFYMHALGSDPQYVVARVEIDLRAEVRYTDRQLQVRIEVERVGTTSLTTRETILTPTGQTAAQARVVTVLWDADARSPKAFTADERARLAALPEWGRDFGVVGGRDDNPVHEHRLRNDWRRRIYTASRRDAGVPDCPRR
jgi:acyl-CoA thioester hydrolase